MNSQITRSLLFLALSCSLTSSLLAQGNVETWGLDGFHHVVSNSPVTSGFVQVTTGDEYSVALHSDGTLTAWGSDGYGQVSGTPTGGGYTQVAAAVSHAVALHSDGSLVSWGSLAGSPGGHDFVQVTAGDYHNVARRADGSLVAWGDDGGQWDLGVFYPWGVVNDTPTGIGFIDVAAGDTYTAAITAQGTIVAWGFNYQNADGNLPLGAGFAQLACGSKYGFALNEDGSITSWPTNSQQVTALTPPGNDFIQVDAWWNLSGALREDGSLLLMNLETLDFGGIIANAPGGEDIVSFSLDGFHASLVRVSNDGAAYCLGDGSGAACPCGNNGNAGEGCANSSGNGGAILNGIGAPWLSADSYRLKVRGGPAGASCIALRGINQLSNGLGNPWGGGLLCTGGQTARSQVQTLGPQGGTLFEDFQGQTLGASSYGAGVTANYQVWYRDPLNTCTGAGFNFTNAWSVTWLL